MKASRALKAACASALAGTLALTCGAGLAAPDDYERGLALYDRGEYSAALELFSSAARAGHVRSLEIAAIMRLAGPALYGAAVARDRAKAEAWLARAAQSGSAVARHLECGLRADEPARGVCPARRAAFATHAPR